MPTLATVVTSPQNPRQSAGEFWRAYDAGDWNAKPPEESPPASTTADAKEAEEKFEKLLNDSDKEAPKKTESQPDTEPQPSTDDADNAGEKSTNETTPDKAAEIK